ncbi:MAG: ABC transporter ATP-binding protein [Deltaproteobacteria bacterium]|jgi:microcin C transport system ATP-binding protein|nr:ABC transporter ATP-binding protein [Deltaproteobacteria bacterium]
MSPLLSVSDLRVNFATPSGPLEAVRGLSFDVNRGETVALVGESGSGKSVTALSVLQLLPYPGASHPSGSIRFEQRELMGAPAGELQEIRGDRIAMIFQEPMTSLNPLHRVEKQIAETLMLHRGATAATARARALELLDRVGIADPESRLNSYPHELSGGQRQRVMIAMALANDPDLLIADEPTTALDVTIQAQILALLEELQTEFGMAILLITHDLGIVRKLSDRVCVMTNGKIVEAGTVDRLFESPAHPYTQHLLGAEPKGEPPTPRAEAREVMQCRDVRVWFPIKRGIVRRTVAHLKAVEGVSLSVREGETLGVVGESGSGKTTLGLALLRLQSSSGSIEFQGREIQSLRWKETRPLRREMQMVFQDPFSSLSPRMSVGSIVEEGLRIHALGDAAERERQVIRVLEEVGLDPDSRHRYPHEFSGGQRQRVAIARAIVLQPRLVILDEPTSALDRSVQAQIVDLLRDLQQRYGLSYLFISHDLRVVRALSHYVVVMRDGCVVEQGASDEIFHDPQQDYTRRLMRAAFELEVA